MLIKASCTENVLTITANSKTLEFTGIQDIRIFARHISDLQGRLARNPSKPNFSSRVPFSPFFNLLRSNHSFDFTCNGKKYKWGAQFDLTGPSIDPQDIVNAYDQLKTLLSEEDFKAYCQYREVLISRHTTVEEVLDADAPIDVTTEAKLRALIKEALNG